jgi:Fe-S-cluster-containing dehydrogenase component/DMSO reductase anchor subunit
MTTTLPQLDSPSVPSRPASVHPGDLISQLLQEQSTLTAVEQFSTWHQLHSEPEQAKYYRDLLPAAMPIGGQQLAFEVDLDRCSGCKACVVACHSLNGLDDEESFRDVGLLLGTLGKSAAFQHVTTACHHCIDPGCLDACPVNAYEKDPVTGIVRHLDDQCFGCQYCTLACPYEVPKYHAAKGIVRKCDMCSQRLAVGEAPACVQACPHQAISIRTIEIAAAKTAAQSMTFLPHSPNPQITVPTTRFVGKAVGDSGLRAGTYAVCQLEHAHWPLVVLLVFSQISVGIATLVLLLQSFSLAAKDSALLLGIATLLAVIGAISSTLHLGRPQFAYRAILGIRHSWLSREIVAFGVFIPLCMASVGLAVMESSLLPLCLAATMLSGATGVVASVMIYHVTHRPFWNAARSAPAFLATSFGVSSLVVMMTLQLSSDSGSQTMIRALAAVALLSGLMKLFLLSNSLKLDRKVTQYTAQQLNPVVRLQWISGMVLLAMVGLLALLPSGWTSIVLTAAAIVAGLLTNFTERYLFFRAVVPLRMPGVVKS